MKRIITIYQIDECEDTRNNYKFMNWEYAESRFNPNDYSFQIMFDVESDVDDNTLLEHIFRLGNDGTLRQKFSFVGHSLSVSDIIEIDGVCYYIDSFGFKKLDVEF